MDNKSTLTMQLDLDQIKDLITFAKANMVKNLTVGNVSIEISELAHLPSDNGVEMGQSKNPAISGQFGDLTSDYKLSAEEEEELLFHSSRP